MWPESPCVRGRGMNAPRWGSATRVPWRATTRLKPRASRWGGRGSIASVEPPPRRVGRCARYVPRARAPARPPLARLMDRGGPARRRPATAGLGSSTHGLRRRPLAGNVLGDRAGALHRGWVGLGAGAVDGGAARGVGGLASLTVRMRAAICVGDYGFHKPHPLTGPWEKWTSLHG